jgi:flavin-dependent dehydrogenase
MKLKNNLKIEQKIKQAKEKKNFSATSLSVYQALLENSFVLKDLKTFQYAPAFLDNPRLFQHYPQMAGDLLQSLFAVGPEPKPWDGASRVTVNTQKNNSASLALYTRIGFKATGEKYPVYQYVVEFRQ